MAGPFTERVRSIIALIPRGRVATYGQVALLAGHPRAARQVSWILHSSSRRYALPWHRVIGGRGTLSLQPGRGYEEQRALLLAEGVCFDGHGRVDMERHRWKPRTGEIEKL